MMHLVTAAHGVRAVARRTPVKSSLTRLLVVRTATHPFTALVTTTATHRRPLSHTPHHRSSASTLAEAFARLDGDIGPDGSSGHRRDGEDGVGRLQIDARNKTISTAVGSLPISPVMDVDFHAARARWRGSKRRVERGEKVGGRFRRVLARNPFGMALSFAKEIDTRMDLVADRLVFGIP